MSEKITKAEALEKIEELQRFIQEEDAKAKTEAKSIGIAIKSCFNSAEIKFQSTKSTIKEAVLEAIANGSDLSDSDLRGSDLRGSDLSGSNLRGSNLRGSNLSGSDLSGSNLSGSDLSDSNLSDSNLSGSDLSGSDLSGSNLSGSDLLNAEMQNAKFYGRGGHSPLKRDQIPAFLAALGFDIVDE